MIDTYVVCKEINNQYGCPPVPEKYAGQLELGCKVWGDYGNRVYNSGPYWFLDDKFCTEVRLPKDFPYWPSYGYNLFSNFLLRFNILSRG